MGNTKNLQKNIKKTIKQLGLSQKEVSRRIFVELNEYNDDESDLEKFSESFKKQLNRASTKPEVLETYFGVIGSFSEFKKSDLVVPNKLNLGFIDDEIRCALNVNSQEWLKERREEQAILSVDQ